MASRVLTAFTLVALAAGTASAHVVADSTLNNRYLKLDVSRDRVRLVYTLYFGDAPAISERQKMDTSHDGQLDDAEAKAYGDALVAQIVPKLTLELDGQKLPVKPADTSVGLGVALVAAGSFSIDLVLEAVVPARAQHSLYFDHAWDPDRPGETEVTIQVEPGLELTAAHVGRHGQGVTTHYVWKGSGTELGDDRSLGLEWRDPDVKAAAAPAGPETMPWWLALSHRPDLGAVALPLAFILALLLGALDGAAPARLTALASGRPVSPIADALARSLMVGIMAVPVGRMCEQVAAANVRSLSLAMAAALVAIGVATLVVALRGGPKPRPGDDALRSAVRSPAIWAAIVLVAFFARASLAILLAALFAAGNLLASATLGAPAVAARLRGPDGPKLRRATTVAAGAALVIFGLGLASLLLRKG